MASDNSGVGTEDTFLPDYSTVLDFQKAVLPHVVNAVKKSNELPEAGDTFDYYSSFPAFRELMQLESRRLLQLINAILKHQNLRSGAIANSDDISEIEDKFDALIEANDQLLERVGTCTDEAAGLRKKEPDIVVAELNVSSSNAIATTNASTAASWNSRKSLGLHDDGKRRTNSTFRLLASRSVDRPQLKFKDKVDNSKSPFIPRLVEKPNALRPWQDPLQSVEAHDYIDPTAIRHPYEYELEQLSYTEKQLTKCPALPQLPLAVEDSSPVQFVDQEVDLTNLVKLLKNESEIAVDLEHHSYRTYQGITCLMQLSTRKQDFIVDTLELRSQLHILNHVFTDPKIVKVFHGADSDINWLQRDLGLYVVNMFDTHFASRALSHARHSLAHLLHHYCGVHADKQYQLADWRIRPLPVELLRYAQEDTHYLLYIYDRMRDELIDKSVDSASSGSSSVSGGLLHTVLEQSRRLCAKVYAKPLLKEDGYMELYLKSKKVFNRQQLLALEQLFRWRDETARIEDESPAYVLPNHMLLQISEHLPREPEGILACCSPQPPLVKMHQGTLHRLVTEARQLPLQKAEVIRVEAAVKRAAQKESLLHCLHDTTSSTSRVIPSAPARQATPIAVKLKVASSLFASHAISTQRLAQVSAQAKLRVICQSFVSLFDKYQPVKIIDLAAQYVSKKKELPDIEVSPRVSAVQNNPQNELSSQDQTKHDQPSLELVEDSAADSAAVPPTTVQAPTRGQDELLECQPLRKRHVSASESASKHKQKFLKPMDEDFHAYDYTKTDMSIFSEKPKKPKQRDEDGIEPLVRPSGSRSRTQLNRGGKSISFKQRSGSSASSKQNPSGFVRR